MKSSNLAIVFVDIAGFAERTSTQSRGQSEAWLRRYEELLLPLVRAFKGQKVKSIGDAYLITFTSPTNALHFAMASQDRLYDYNRFAPACERIEIRVACNVGEVRQLRGDVYGEPVNIAARLENITPTGEIWFTEAVFLAMTKSEVPSEEIGERSLKGIKDLVRIYQIPKGPNYRLSSQDKPMIKGDGQANPNDTKIPIYPFGGIGLKHAEKMGWATFLTNTKSKIMAAGWQSLQFANWCKAKIHNAPSKMVFGAVCIVLLGLLLALVWPENPYHDIYNAIEAGDPNQALSMLDRHVKGDEPAGQALRAQALLMQKNADVEKAADLLRNAVLKKPSLLRQEQVIKDLVACLNRDDAKKTMNFLQEKSGNAAIPYLIDASRSERYWLRWNSIRLLEKMGEQNEVDMAFAYMQDLRFAGSCSTRKQAAKQLALLKDRRALVPLRKAKDRNFFENLCMGDTLEESIQTIEKE